MITNPSYLDNIMRDINIRRLYNNSNLKDNHMIDIEPKPICLGSKIEKVSKYDNITNLYNSIREKCASYNVINQNHFHFFYF